MKNNPQGSTPVELPEPVKNAIHAAQNRVTLLEGDQARLQTLNAELEGKIGSLQRDLATTQGLVDEKGKELAEKAGALSKLSEDIQSVSDSFGKKAAELGAIQVEVEKANDELRRVNNQIKEQAKKKEGMDLENSKLELEVGLKKKKIEAFVEAVEIFNS